MCFVSNNKTRIAMGQISLETALAIDVVLGLCCLQNVCCPFLSVFSCQK